MEDNLLDFSEPLSNFDLFQIGEEIDLLKLEILSKNQFVKINEHKQYIINLQDLEDGDGSHWVAVYMHDDTIFYFDSYGYPPPQVIVDLSIQFRTPKNIVFSIRELQHPDSILCGWFCLAFLYQLVFNEDKRDAYDNFINIFSDNRQQNEKIIKEVIIDIFEEVQNNYKNVN